MADATRKGASQGDSHDVENAAAADANDTLPPEDVANEPAPEPKAKSKEAAPAAPVDKAAQRRQKIEEAKKPENNPAWAGLNDIYANRRRQIEETLAEQGNGETLGRDDQPADDQPADEGDQPAPDEGEGGTPPADDTPSDPEKKGPEYRPGGGEMVDPKTGERLIKVKVDGDIKLVPESQVVAGFQKAQSSTQRFEQASQMRKEAAAYLAKAIGRPEPAPQPAQAPTAQDTGQQPQQQDGGQPPEDQQPAPDPDVQARLTDIVQALQYGEGDESVKAAQELLELARSQQPDPQQQVSPDEVAQRAAQLVSAHQAHQERLNRVGQAYPQIFEDRELTYLATERVHQLRAQELMALGYPETDVNEALGSLDGRRALMQLHQQEQTQGNVSPEEDVYNAACQAVSDKFGLKAPEQPQGGAAPAPTPTREQRKAALPRQPKPAGGRSQVGTPEPERRKPSDIVTAMRKARGFSY